MPSEPNVTRKIARPRAVGDATALAQQLPLWHEKVRGLPNPMARSALFTVGNKSEPRLYYKTHKTIQTLGGYTITYKGEELRQDDEDVFLQLAHLARNQPLSERVEFTAYALLKELGWKRSGEGYTRLRETLDRLQGTGLRIASTDAAEGFQGALVRKFMWRADDGASLSRWVVWLEPEIVKLFGPAGYTQVLWEQRLRLRSALAKYLHGYYATHEAPYSLKVATLHLLSGSRAARLGDFRKLLRKALDELVAERFLDSWSIDAGDLVHVVRTPKSRQHLPRRDASGV